MLEIVNMFIFVMFRVRRVSKWLFFVWIDDVKSIDDIVDLFIRILVFIFFIKENEFKKESK